jgi:hypothetical protein
MLLEVASVRKAIRRRAGQPENLGSIPKWGEIFLSPAASRQHKDTFSFHLRGTRSCATGGKVETGGAKLTTQTHLGHRSSLLGALPPSFRPYILLTFCLIIKALWWFLLKNADLWDMTPCSLLGIYRRFEGSCCSIFRARVQIYASL